MTRKLGLKPDTRPSAVDKTVPFMFLGDMLDAFDHNIHRDDFWRATRISAFFKGGQHDLRTWQTLNGMEDYTRLFDDSDFKPRSPRRRQKQKREFSWAGAAQPV